METTVKKAAVLGAGVMGSQLAAHLANAGVEALLYDLTQEQAEQGLAGLAKLKPAPLFSPRYAERITPCNYDDHLERLAEADWVIEAVAERLDIKEAVYRRIAPHLKPEAVLTSNTSGLPLADLAAALPPELARRFMITHFFNPPRYMRLLELVAGEATEGWVVEAMARAGEALLGKGIVHAKDTPNFIGNRIGVYAEVVTIATAIEMGLTVEEVDRLTGTVAGRPKSATFRTADLVGLDVLGHVVRTAYERGEGDEERERLRLPPIVARLIEEGRLGQKSGAGFYRKEPDRTILALDLETGEYRPQKRVRFDCLRVAKEYQSVAARIRALCAGDDPGSRFFWTTLARTLIYAANRIPEISDDLVSIDRALRWGFAWRLGPFETWDALGVRAAFDRMVAEGMQPPAWVERMLASGRDRFYGVEGDDRTVYDPVAAEVARLAPRPGVVDLDLLKRRGRERLRHWSASLVELGDGVLDLEFHSILQPDYNPLDGSVVEVVERAVEELEAGRARALVIGHQGEQFCAGANLAMILGFCERRDWDGLERAVAALQQAMQHLRFAPGPVVAAPFHLALGGGWEIIAACDHRVAAAELYTGAVEVGVGLIPGAGGNLRLLVNLMDAMAARGRVNPYGAVQKAFETIGFAKVSTSAAEAKWLGYLRRDDTVVMNLDHVIDAARRKALELAEGYRPPAYRDDLHLPGVGARTAIETVLHGMRIAGKISAHDERIGKALAHVLSGGERAHTTRPVDEQYLLDLEREAFLSLAAEPLTQDRIRHMLKKGKPLRN